MEQKNRQPNNIKRPDNKVPVRRVAQTQTQKKASAENTTKRQLQSRTPKANTNSALPTVAKSSVQQSRQGVQNKKQATSATPKAQPKISREERERLLKEEMTRINQKRKARFDYIVSLLILFAVAFVIMAMVFVTAFYISLVSHKSPDTKSYSLLLSDYDNDIEIESGSVVGDDGSRYVNFSQIAEFYGFAMVGSIDNMKYVIKGSENETVAFKPDSDKAMVNDVIVRTEGPAFYENGDLYVSESFVNEYVSGFDITTDAKARTVSMARKLLNAVDAEGKIADGKDPEYENIEFMLKAPMPTMSISETDSAVVMPTFEFNANLSAYEEYMNPGSTTEFLTLVNEAHKLSEDYIPTGLSLLKYGEGMYLKEYAAKSFEAMMLEANACGVTGVTVTRAYVSYDEAQTEYEEVVDKYVNLLGNDQANRYASATVSPPGTDEHQTGLALDLGLTVGAEFTSSTAFAWLCDNSYKFGFVLRYPPSKTDATGHVYKPEQFRYVGRYHAVRMNALGLTLDEYAEYLGL